MAKETIGDSRGIELVDDGLDDLPGQGVPDRGDLLPDLGRGQLGVLFQDEGGQDDRDALGRGRGDLVDAVDGAQGVLDRLGDLGFHLLGADAGIGDRHGHVGQGDVGHQVDAEPGIGQDAHDHQGEDDHGDEDGLFDRNIGDSHGGIVPYFAAGSAARRP